MRDFPHDCGMVDTYASCLHNNGLWTCSIVFIVVPVTEYLYMQCELKWIAMPENLVLANNSASLQPVGMHVRCVQLRFWLRCRRGRSVDGRVTLTLDTPGSPPGNSVAQWVSDSRYRHATRVTDTAVTTAAACFHGKFAANSRAKFVHCHIHLWCLVYESVRSAYRTAVMMIGRECQKARHARHLWLNPSLW